VEKGKKEDKRENKKLKRRGNNRVFCFRVERKAYSARIKT
jgi:hypothetical protein